MRNQKEISEQRFSRVRWQRKEDGSFYGTATITRKVIGDLDVKFVIFPSGEVEVAVECLFFPCLNMKARYESYGQAVEGVKTHVETIDKILSRLSTEEVVKAKIRANKAFTETIEQLLAKEMAK